MQMLVGGDDDRGHFRPLEQLAEIAGEEIGADLLRHLLGARGPGLGDADPIDLRVPRGDLAAEQTDPAGADDGKPDAFRVLFDGCLPLECELVVPAKAAPDRGPGQAPRPASRDP
jgi:hypothetical protein